MEKESEAPVEPWNGLTKTEEGVKMVNTNTQLGAVDLTCRLIQLKRSVLQSPTYKLLLEG